VIEDGTRGRELIRRNLLEGDVPGNTHQPWLGLVTAGASRQAGVSVDTMLDRLTRQCRLLTFSGTYAAYTDWLAAVARWETA
jgi:hypothetical protein